MRSLKKQADPRRSNIPLPYREDTVGVSVPADDMKVASL